MTNALVRPRHNAIARGASAIIPPSETHFLMKVFDQIPGEAKAAQEFFYELTAPKTAIGADPGLPIKVQIELALDTFCYLSNDEAKSLIDYVDDCKVCTAGFGSSIPELNRNRQTKLDTCQREIALLGKRATAKLRPERWGGGPEMGSEESRLTCGRARAIMSPFSMAGGTKIFEMLDRVISHRDPEDLQIVTPSGEVYTASLTTVPFVTIESPEDPCAESVFLAVVAKLDPKLRTLMLQAETIGKRNKKAFPALLLALLSSFLISGLAITGLTTDRITSSFPLLLDVLRRASYSGVAVALSGTAALEYELSKPAFLKTFTVGTKECLAYSKDELVNVCRKLWALMEPGIGMPVAFLGAAARLHGQRDWILRLCRVYVDRRHGHHPRSIETALEGLFEAAIASFQPALALWDLIAKKKRPPDAMLKRYVDWAPSMLVKGVVP
ncbi:hypothetical protein [Cupriavidus sp. CuC1]|uniref:hypothetical protein n=1 Tax=Cupriavidus sp. CuC1 TaxID=3373131 RepID=UPI0037D7D203